MSDYVTVLIICLLFVFSSKEIPFLNLSRRKHVRDRAWFVRQYGEMISSGIIDRTGSQTMLYLTCTTITNVDLTHYGVSHAKDWVSVDCGTIDVSCGMFSNVISLVLWIVIRIH